MFLAVHAIGLQTSACMPQGQGYVTVSSISVGATTDAALEKCIVQWFTHT